MSKPAKISEAGIERWVSCFVEPWQKNEGEMLAVIWIWLVMTVQQNKQITCWGTVANDLKLSYSCMLEYSYVCEYANTLDIFDIFNGGQFVSLLILDLYSDSIGNVNQLAFINST